MSFPTGRWNPDHGFWDLIGMSFLVARPGRRISVMFSSLPQCGLCRPVNFPAFQIEVMALPGCLTDGYSSAASRDTGC